VIRFVKSKAGAKSQCGSWTLVRGDWCARCKGPTVVAQSALVSGQTLAVSVRDTPFPRSLVRIDCDGAAVGVCGTCYADRFGSEPALVRVWWRAMKGLSK
jgi:hypothetical protein